mmetsp:Transcript_4766/g.13587  ORF Transcript_4766/g.13587 Transcript_4766/m.13587 type:complete len:115 (-) Transcript_4766:3030-3374(-)
MFMNLLVAAQEDRAKEEAPVALRASASDDSAAPSSDARGDALARDLEIVTEVAEFIFDLWDANCLPEYKRIEAFEERALPAFAELVDVDSDDAEEYRIGPFVATLSFHATLLPP